MVLDGLVKSTAVSLSYVLKQLAGQRTIADEWVLQDDSATAEIDEEEKAKLSHVFPLIEVREEDVLTIICV